MAVLPFLPCCRTGRAPPLGPGRMVRDTSRAAKVAKAPPQSPRPVGGLERQSHRAATGLPSECPVKITCKATGTCTCSLLDVGAEH